MKYEYEPQDCSKLEAGGCILNYRSFKNSLKIKISAGKHKGYFRKNYIILKKNLKLFTTIL